MTLGALMAATLAVGLQTQDRIREQLPNGSRVLVQRVVDRDDFALTLAIGFENVPETAESHGLRHLLEHLIADSDGTLDRDLERAGCTLTAFTTRDGTTFTISGPADQLPRAFASLEKLVQPTSISEERIARELVILAEEEAVRPVWARFLDAAMDAAYGPASLNPFGNLEVMSKLSVDQVRSAQGRFWGSGAVSLVVEGGIDPGATMTRARQFLGRLPNLPRADDPGLSLQPRARRAVGGRGAARAVPVDGLDDPRTVATIAAALALRRNLPGSVVVYEPALQPGVVLLWTPDAPQLMEIERFDRDDRARLTAEGLLLADAWARGLRGSPEQSTMREAMFLLRRPGFTFRDVEELALGLTAERVQTALDSFGAEQAWEVMGR